MLRRFDIAFYLALAFILSFCSMCYELLLVRVLSSLSYDAVLSQSVTVGVFLLSLGIGALFYSKLKKWRERDPLGLLFTIEIAIAVFALLAIPTLQIASLYIKGASLVWAAQIVTVAIGIFCGVELPALMDLLKPRLKNSFAWVLFANYLGAFFASIATSTILVPSLGPIVSAWGISLFSAFAAALLFLKRFRFAFSWHYIALPLVIFLPSLFASHLRVPLEQFYLKSYYYMAPKGLSDLKNTLILHSRFPPIERTSSPFQEIDVVRSNANFFVASGFTEAPPEPEFFLYLDQKFQVSSGTEAIYHETMVHGGLNLAMNRPNPPPLDHVLIVGGGDGLIARELLEYPGIRSITVVELDEEVVGIARRHPLFAKLTRGAYENSRVKVEFADGFEWLKKNKKKYGAIFIDLPHPVSVDLARLYSVEFFRFVKRALWDDASVIFDFPADGILLSGSKQEMGVFASILGALKGAGFESFAAFGSWESFLIAGAGSREFEFDYGRVDSKVSDQSAANLVKVKLGLEPARANSIFRPTYLKERSGQSE